MAGDALSPRSSLREWAAGHARRGARSVASCPARPPPPAAPIYYSIYLPVSFIDDDSCARRARTRTYKARHAHLRPATHIFTNSPPLADCERPYRFSKILFRSITITLLILISSLDTVMFVNERGVRLGAPGMFEK